MTCVLTIVNGDADSGGTISHASSVNPYVKLNLTLNLKPNSNILNINIVL